MPIADVVAILGIEPSSLCHRAIEARHRACIELGIELCHRAIEAGAQCWPGFGFEKLKPTLNHHDLGVRGKSPLPIKLEAVLSPA